MHLSETAGHTFACAKLGEVRQRFSPDFDILTIFLAKDYEGNVPILMEFPALKPEQVASNRKTHQASI